MKNKALHESGKKFLPEAIASLREAIEEISGNEVFAIGACDKSGMISEVEIVARGSVSSVPALESWFEKGSVLIHNHPSGNLLPSEADVEVAAQAGSYGVGSYIVDNDVAYAFVIAEPVRQKPERRLDCEDIGAVLEYGGKLSRIMPSFEPRESQVLLARDAAAILNDGGILAAEAGTGVGKSFAYLVPSLAWAIANDTRVVISTATINLQDQLFTKDIPIIASMFKKPVKSVLVKGRSNYLCKQRLGEAIAEEGIFLKEDDSLKKILDWDNSGGSGDRADIPFSVEDSLWSRVCSESESCLALHCGFREKCHVLQVRKNAASAQVIVVNHHLLFADIASRNRSSGGEQTAILPSYSALILDEAHSLESSATSLFTEEFTKFSIFRHVSRLKRSSKTRTSGLLPRLAKLPDIDRASLDKAENALKPLQNTMAELENEALRMLSSVSARRLKPADAQAWRGLTERCEQLQQGLLAVSSALASSLANVEATLSNEALIAEAKLLMRSMNDTAVLASRFKDYPQEEDIVFWIQKEQAQRKDPFISFNATPLDVAPLLEKTVFKKIPAIICTSATLAIGGSFHYWMQRSGIDPKKQAVTARIYRSPFPFSSNALLAIDKESPSPQKSPQAFKDYVITAIPRLVLASRGRALVLFTSYDLLNAAYAAAEPLLTQAGLPCLRQGMDSRSRLLSMFKEDIPSVLFATDSFWEGVDAPGETLSQVIITKLPFRVPNDPVPEARAEAIEKSGKNAFMEISLPEAIIKFKQGFGRLIRHSEDRGAVVVLDSRLVHASYGQLFINSLPESILVVDSLSVIEKKVENFLT